MNIRRVENHNRLLQVLLYVIAINSPGKCPSIELKAFPIDGRLVVLPPDPDDLSNE